ncbi:hypothetical protein PTSG_07012 [Salpingoeca rosetta]|uniref:Uncharacterized protein n=1 Tax=Salpingoeca rosetta (strain ATCC 50818 / BSB-021) TaxID=946362 RepID=F2UDS9_SALR5|nr:uncharacterized protein PTSG_07012 [Salpingoeca rosetta]EGD74779.1 hypothetical protein PTSG_07012 [Salpingoeca rosetta]|eukprot:XP_004992424.1 hypothetical protein PTSG_07012 [Salpingoeca rosetta]
MIDVVDGGIRSEYPVELCELPERSDRILDKIEHCERVAHSVVDDWTSLIKTFEMCTTKSNMMQRRMLACEFLLERVLPALRGMDRVKVLAEAGGNPFKGSCARPYFVKTEEAVHGMICAELVRLIETVEEEE